MYVPIYHYIILIISPCHNLITIYTGVYFDRFNNHFIFLDIIHQLTLQEIVYKTIYKL